MKRLLIALFLVLMPVSVWAGGDIYVATTGSDVTGTGAIGAPVQTIAHAITHITDANGGWNIILRGGTYNEHDLLIGATRTGTSGAWNTMRSYPGEWAIIDGQNSSSLSNIRAVIYNNDGNECTNHASSFAQYWIFERLEITGGGTASTGVETQALFWVGGPFTMRYCYIHDNQAGDDAENPSAVSGTQWQGNTIEYNYFTNNGSVNHGVGDPGNGNTVCGPQVITCWEYSGYDYAAASRNNTIRYNRIVSNGDVGMRYKASNRLTAIRDESDTSQQENGDKVHHNVITGAGFWGILWQQDYAQIYNNIVHIGSTNGGYGIVTRRWGSEGVDMLFPCVYNNTIIDSHNAGIDNYIDAKYGQTLKWWAVNNIIDNNTDGSNSFDITYAHADLAGYYHSETFPTSFTISNVKIDRNYLYRAGTTSSDAILYGLIPGTGDNYTVAQWESANAGVDMFQNSYNAGDLLYVGTSGADAYRTRSAHVLEGSDTIGNAGLGSAHPYLSGVTLPSYIGATNPSDDDWVAGVLALDATYFTSVTNGSDPTWIEGSESTPPSTPSITGVMTGIIR